MNLIDFYLGGQPLTCVNQETLTLNEILMKDDVWWEHCHNHIQWCFPTRKPSKMNLNSPILTQEIARIINDYCSEVFHEAVERFFLFLNSVDNWNQYNHNYLRISRVIESYRLITNDQEKAALIFNRFIESNIFFSEVNLFYMMDSLNQNW